jgi:hypothetical protein
MIQHLAVAAGWRKYGGAVAVALYFVVLVELQPMPHQI